MQQRAMACCEEKINARGKPAKLLTIMPQLFVNDEWFGTQRSEDDREELGAALAKITYSFDDKTADHYDAGKHNNGLQLWGLDCDSFLSHWVLLICVYLRILGDLLILHRRTVCCVLRDLQLLHSTKLGISTQQ